MKKGKTTGARALVKALEKEGVEIIFGYPGGANLPIYEALGRSQIRHILARHEQGAAHMADGYARATGKVGVCLATSGPGATNLVTGLATAYMDSSSVLAITGQVPRSMIGNDAFQEVDITGITIPITKHNYLVQEESALAPTLEEAFYLAQSGRRGSVLVDIPKDILLAEYYESEEIKNSLEGYSPTTKGHPGQIKRAAALITASEKPVILAGGGIISSDSFKVFDDFIQNTGIPTVHTLMGKGAFDNLHPLNLGLFGYHGKKTANRAVTEADLIIAVGTRFGDRSTGPLASFGKTARIIHIDIDPAEISKNVPAYLPIVGDITDILPRLIGQVSKSKGFPKKNPWIGRLLAESEEKKSKAKDFSFDIPEILEAPVTTRYILSRAKHFFPDPILVTDVGRHQIYAAQDFPVKGGRNFVSSGGLGTMGFGLPAAIGAALACPSRRVLLISGDGSFLMNCQELASAAETGVSLTALIIHDKRLGMIKQLQDDFYKNRFDISRFEKDIRFDRLAESLGCRGVRVSSARELEKELSAASGSQGVTVLDCMVGEESNVYPMVVGSTLMDLIEGDDQ